MQKIKNLHKKEAGFTLIELILVVAILAIILVAIVLILDPSRRVSEARNTERQSDLRNIGEAIKTFQVDNEGPLPTGIDNTLRVLGTNGAGCDQTCGGEATAASCLNISGDIAGSYIASIPTDPLSGSVGETDYAIRRYGTTGVILRACSAELGETIEYIR